MNKIKNLETVFDFLSNYLNDEEPRVVSSIKANVSDFDYTQTITGDNECTNKECTCGKLDVPPTPIENFNEITKDLADIKNDNLRSNIFGRGTKFEEVLGTEEGRTDIINMMKRMDKLEKFKNTVDEHIKIRDLNKEIRTLNNRIESIQYENFINNMGDNTNEAVGVTLGDDGSIERVKVNLMQPLTDTTDVDEVFDNASEYHRRFDEFMKEKYPIHKKVKEPKTYESDQRTYSSNQLKTFGEQVNEILNRKNKRNDN